MNVAVSKNGRRALWGSFFFLLVFLYAPLVILVIFSFNDREFLSFPWEGFTLRWYQKFIHNPILLDSLKTSAIIAIVTSVVTTALGTPASIAMSRTRFKAKELVTGLLLAPLVIPLVVLGTALLIFFNWLQKVVGVEIDLGMVSIIVAHVVIALPFAILTILPRLERIPVALEEAARDLGATGWTTFRTITFPLLAPAVISASLISLTISFDEIVLAEFVGGRTTTFPRYLWSQMRLPRELPQVIGVAVIVLIISVFLVVGAEIVRRKTDQVLEASTTVQDETEVTA